MALTVYRTWPKSDSKLLGKFSGRVHVNGNLCSPACISISFPAKERKKGKRKTKEKEMLKRRSRESFTRFITRSRSDEVILCLKILFVRVERRIIVSIVSCIIQRLFISCPVSVCFSFYLDAYTCK